MTVHALPIAVSDAADLPGKHTGRFTYGDTPEDIARDNYRRATFAAVAVKAYAKACGTERNEDMHTILGDLFGDLRHLIDCLNADPERQSESDYADGLLDFDALSDRGWRHYDPETRGEL